MQSQPTIPRVCLQCGADFYAYTSQARRGVGLYCSRTCASRAAFLGERNPRWHGGPITRLCESCGQEFTRPHGQASRPGRGRFCSHACAARVNCSGPKNYRWRGGRRKMHTGYIQITTPDGRIMTEHRYVMEQLLGRHLEPSESVHHINHDRADNRPENLQLAESHAEHMRLHRLTRWATTRDACAICGEASRPHVAHGACKRCYQRFYYRRSKHFGQAPHSQVPLPGLG